MGIFRYYRKNISERKNCIMLGLVKKLNANTIANDEHMENMLGFTYLFTGKFYENDMANTGSFKIKLLC